MKLSDLKKLADIKKVDFKNAKNCYQGTDTPIKYARFNRPVEGVSFMTLSHNAYDAIVAKKVKPEELDYVLTDDNGWKGQLADSMPSDDALNALFNA